MEGENASTEHSQVEWERRASSYTRVLALTYGRSVFWNHIVESPGTMGTFNTHLAQELNQALFDFDKESPCG